MDVIRFGLGIRALRRRRRWAQQRLADQARVSRSVIVRIERGRADRVAVHTLIRVAAAVGASINLRLLWQGEGLDRILDGAHADIVERVVLLLAADGWITATEVSFSVEGERGSIDVLAFHEPTGSLLVVEVKSVVPDLQALLHGIDRKTRIAAQVAMDRGWRAVSVSRLLVLPDDRTSRRRVEAHAATSQVHCRTGPSRSSGGCDRRADRSPGFCSCQTTLRRSLVTALRLGPPRCPSAHAPAAAPSVRISTIDDSGGHLAGIR